MVRGVRAAAAVRLELRLVNRTTHRRVLQLPSAIRDPHVLRTLLLLDLESHAPSEAIDIVTIEVDPAPGRVVQFSLLERALPSPETLTTLTARLVALVGESRCGSPLLLDTHRPDAFEMRRFDPQPKRRDRSAGGAADLSHDQCFWSEHPLGLFTARTRAAGVGAILRRFRPPIAIRVAIDGGRPAHVAIDRRGMPGGRVVQASGPWRSSGAWWEPAGMPWNRDEWDVELADGSVCRLFCDRESGVWFLEGVAD